MARNRLTIIIPTMNRPDFVARLLNYYANAGFEHHLAIGDSSNSANVEITRAALASIGGRLDVSYHEYPGLSCHAAQKALSESVDSQYVVCLPDDDFVVPAGLNQCMDFLDAHAEYVAAHGLGIVLERDASRAYGVGSGFYRQPVLEAETAQQRVLDLLGDYSVPAFSVHRAEAFTPMFATELSDRIFGELLVCGVSAVLGKVKQLDCFYLVRQVHEGRYQSSDVFDWVTGASWQASYNAFADRLSTVMSARAGISTREAKDVVKRAFWSYLVAVLAAHRPSAQPGRDAVPGAIKRLMGAPFVPGWVRPLVGSMRQTRGRGLGVSAIRLALPVLLRPRTRYHDAFMPIYRAVAGELDGG